MTAVIKQSTRPSLARSILDILVFILTSAYLILKAIYESLFTTRPRKEIKGEVALVTGGGGGLGRLVALRLAKLGATVVLWDINEKGVEETVELVKGIGGKAYGFKCDIADKDAVYSVAKKTQKEVGDISILINNAGVATGQLLLDTPDHLIKKTFDVNIIAHFWTVKAFLPKMIERDRGHIVTVASMAGFVGVSKLVDYCSSKYAAVGFDEALRVELEQQGILGVKTTVVCPYFIQQTGMFDNVNSRFFPTLKSNDVADRIVEALTKEEYLVMLPTSFNFLMILKAMVPWSVMSMFIANFIPDPSPHNQGNPIVQVKHVEETKHTVKNGNSILTSSVSQLNQRLITTGKNL